MARRTLPARTTRGQPPSYLRELPSLTPQRMPLHSEPQEAERREMQNKLKSQQIVNLKKYPFCRAVHYFFDLDTFPRVKGHISYVHDDNNALKNTFPKDQKKLNNVSYGEVLNRKIFGLPVGSGSNPLIRKENRCKNVAYSYLFEIEDKKYQTDRVICSLKVILNKLNKGVPIEQLKGFDFLKKDTQLEALFDNSASLQDKIQIIEEKIAALTSRKQTNAANWETDDKTYFYHSLNQKLHNQIIDLKQNINQDSLIKFIFDQSTNQYQNKKDRKTVLYYYNSHSIALSSSAKIKSTPPVGVFHFEGSLKVLRLAGQIVAKKCESLGETTFYEVKQMTQNLFNFQLALRSQKIQSYSTFLKSFRKRCEEISKNSIQLDNLAQQFSNLDSYVKKGDICLGQRTQISGKQYVLMVIYYWICLGLAQIAPLLEHFPDILSHISSDYFPKVYSYIIHAVKSPILGMMCAAIQALSDLFSKSDPFQSFPVRLLFQFNPVLGVGLLFKEEAQFQTQPSARNFGSPQQQRMTPSKRVKRDNI